MESFHKIFAQILIHYTGQQKKIFFKRQKMLDRFKGKSGVLNPKMHLVLPNWL